MTHPHNKQINTDNNKHKSHVASADLECLDEDGVDHHCAAHGARGGPRMHRRAARHGPVRRQVDKRHWRFGEICACASFVLKPCGQSCCLPLRHPRRASTRCSCSATLPGATIRWACQVRVREARKCPNWVFWLMLLDGNSVVSVCRLLSRISLFQRQ